MQKEHPDTHVVRDVPSFTLYLNNMIAAEKPELDANLQFELLQPAYEALFMNELQFETLEGMQLAREFFAHIKDLEDSESDFFLIHSPFNYTIAIGGTEIEEGEDGRQKEVYKHHGLYRFFSRRSYDYIVDILKWISGQEKYL